MSRMRREHGFWAAVGTLKLKDLWSVEIVVGVGVGLILAAVQTFLGSTGSRVDTTMAFTAIIAALIGIVFAGFALLVAFLSPKYLSFLNEADNGVKTFFQPFMLAIGMQCALLLISVLHASLGPIVFPAIEITAFWIASVMFGACTLEIVALARTVMMQSTVRATHDSLEAAAQANVSPLGKRAGR